MRKANTIKSLATLETIWSFIANITTKIGSRTRISRMTQEAKTQITVVNMFRIIEKGAVLHHKLIEKAVGTRIGKERTTEREV